MGECKAEIKSAVCDGPELPEGVEPGSEEDTRCAFCQELANATGDNLKWEMSLPRQSAQIDQILSAQRGARRLLNTSSAVHQSLLGMNPLVPTPGQHRVRKKKKKKSLGDAWTRYTQSLLIDLFYELCEDQPFIKDAAFAMVFLGSLGRHEATPYSDLEFCFVVQTESEIQAFQNLARDIYQRTGELAKETGSLGTDEYFGNVEKGKWNNVVTTVGLTKFGGKYRRTHYIDDAVYLNNILGGECILGDAHLLEALQTYLKNHFNVIKDAVSTFKLTMDSNVLWKFNWLKKGDPLNVKEHILRPVTWFTIFVGRAYSVPGNGNRSHLAKIYKEGVISREVYELVLETADFGEKIRWEMHFGKGEEHDDIADELNPKELPYEVLRCLKNVSVIMGISYAWIEMEQNPAPPKRGFLKSRFDRIPLQTRKPYDQKFDYLKLELGGSKKEKRKSGNF